MSECVSPVKKLLFNVILSLKKLVEMDDKGKLLLEKENFEN